MSNNNDDFNDLIKKIYTGLFNLNQFINIWSNQPEVKKNLLLISSVTKKFANTMNDIKEIMDKPENKEKILEFLDILEKMKNDENNKDERLNNLLRF